MTFGRRSIEALAKERAARKAANLAALCTPSRSIAHGSYGGGVSGKGMQWELG